MEKFLIIDTETANGFAQPLAYDIGGVVTDKTGFIYERFHFAVLEIIGNPHIMDTAYYADKMPLYWQGVANHEIIPLPFNIIIEKINALVDWYDIGVVGAYNWNFDKRAMSCTAEYVNGVSDWLKKPLQEFCIWCGACRSIMNTKKFVNWCRKNGYTSEAGNPRTTAEHCFRYITGNLDFEEAHTGGKDAEIEAHIFASVNRRKGKHDFTPTANPWKIVADFSKTVQ